MRANKNRIRITNAKKCITFFGDLVPALICFEGDSEVLTFRLAGICFAVAASDSGIGPS